MTTQRETKEIILTGEDKAVVFTYLTGGEFRQVQQVLMGEATAKDVSETKGKLQNLKVGTMMQAQDKALELLIVSVNGVSENALQLAKDLSVKSYNVLVNYATEQMDGGGEDKKK